MRKAIKIIGYVLASVVAIFVACSIAVQTPQVQTFLAKKAVKALNKALGGDITFKMVEMKPFSALVLRDVAILDRHPYENAGIPGYQPQDTIFKARYIVAKFSLKGLLSENGIFISRAYIRDGMLLLTNEPTTTNLTRFFQKHRKSKKKNIVFGIRQVDIRNFRFRMLNCKGMLNRNGKGTGSKPFGINWLDLDVYGINLKGRNLHYSGGTMSGTADALDFKEKSGYVCRNMSGKVKVGNGKTLINGLKLIDNWSDLDIFSFKMSYESSADFKDFANSVKMTGDINKSHLSSRSLSYFAPALRKNRLEAEISGHIQGYVNDFKCSNLRFKEETSGIRGQLDGQLTGLPDSRTLLADFRANRLAFTSKGLATLLKTWSPDSKLDLGKFAKGQQFVFSGTGHGPLNRLMLKGNLSSAIGSVKFDVALRNIQDKGQGVGISGSIGTQNLDIGGILGNGSIRECTMNTALSASIGKSGFNVKIDSLSVQRLNVLGYDYSGLAAAGTYDGDAFNGKIISKDPNINFMFQGIFTLSKTSKNAKYVFYANLGYADLYALHLDKRKISRVSMELNADYTRISKGDILGNLDIKDPILENSQGIHKIGDIAISSHSNNDVNRVKFESAFANGTYVGSKPVGTFIREIENLLLKKELPALFKDPGFKPSGNHYDLSLRFHDSRDLLSFILPGLYIADSTSIRLKVGENGNVKANMTSNRIAYGNKYMKGISLQIDNNDGGLNGKINSGQTEISTLEFKNNTIAIYAEDNEIGLGFSYDNETSLANKGEIYLTGRFSRNVSDSLVCNGNLLSSNIYYDNDGWTINPAKITMQGSKITVDHFNATCNDQSLRINGGISKNGKDTLSCNLVKFNIALVNSLTKQDFGISGLATGRALVTSRPGKQLGLLANLSCDSTMIAGKRAGTIRMASSWDNEDDKFDIVLSNDISGVNTISAKAAYYPEKKKLKAMASFKDADIAYAAPLLSSLFSGMDGRMSGEMTAEGPLDNLSISSNGASFDNAIFKVGFTNVAYMVNGPFHISEKGLFFDGISIRDRASGLGKINGSIDFNHFKNMSLDTHIDVSDMECLNTVAKDNASFYGNVYASGNISVTGPIDAILLDIDATTTKQGSFHIPVSSASNANSGNLLKFYAPEKVVRIDPYEAMMSKEAASKSRKNDMRIRLKINITPLVEGLVELDKDGGNVLSAYGNGQIDLDIRPSRDLFNISGDYNITKGSYHFVALGIAKKDFAIQEGSNIKFNGNIMESDLDVKGTYTTKTSLATLISDTSSVATRKTVECGIGISEKLKNPHLEFSINVLDVDPTTKSRVESALNTDDKIQRQFIALLVSNRFLPSDESGVVNTSNMLYSNVADIMSNQLNSIFEKLDIPLDLGLSYQSNDKGNDLFDVALSTQLFNNRVIVNGTIGNRQYNTTESNQDVVGDLDIEVKLDKPGRLRLNLFSHSADAYTVYLDNTQRNGIGIGYQQEYDSFGQFFRDLFSSKAKKEQRKRDEAAKKEEQVVIDIEK